MCEKIQKCQVVALLHGAAENLLQGTANDRKRGNRGTQNVAFHTQISHSPASRALLVIRAKDVTKWQLGILNILRGGERNVGKRVYSVTYKLRALGIFAKESWCGKLVASCAVYCSHYEELSHHIYICLC